MIEPLFPQVVLDHRKQELESLPLEPQRDSAHRNQAAKGRMGKKDLEGEEPKALDPFKTMSTEDLRPLSDLKPGEKGKVRDIPNEEILRKVLSLGIYPGDTLLVIRKKPLIVFRIGASQFTFDHRLASGIYVE